MAMVKGVEKVVGCEGFDLNLLKGTVKKLNEAEVLEKPIKVVAVKKEVLVDAFLKGIESIPEGSDLEKKIPVEAIKLYNDYGEVIDDKKIVLEAGVSKEKGKVDQNISKEKKTRGRGSSSELKQFLAELISEAKYDRKIIVEKAQQKFPDATAGSITTYLSDGKNPKYNKFDKLVVVGEDKILSFQN